MKGNSREHKMIKDFDKIKVNLMYEINKERVLQHNFLIQLLKSTKGEIIFPGSDLFWGTCGRYENTQGKNWNGKNFERIRKEIF